EIATGGNIDGNAWIDPEVVALAGINADELARYRQPADFARPDHPVAQPSPDPAKPNLVYPPAQYAAITRLPDEAFWHSVDNEPPVKSA
ncbi:MAG TPA: glyoxalase, partial [Acidimicrobiaceae bacterium]|nr:glyoxalase [Acidimicrobiaceae bacterium]